MVNNHSNVIDYLPLEGSERWLSQPDPFICIGNGCVISSSLVLSPGDQKGRLSGLNGKNLSYFGGKRYQDSYSTAMGPRHSESRF